MFGLVEPICLSFVFSYLDRFQVVYRKSALYYAWKCFKSLCGWVVLKVNLVIDFGYSLALAKLNNKNTFISKSMLKHGPSILLTLNLLFYYVFSSVVQVINCNTCRIHLEQGGGGG